jgi:hypothetical protein
MTTSSAWSVLLVFVAACGSTAAPASSVGFADGASLDGSGAGQGAGSVNIAMCDRTLGFRSAIRVATGAKDPALRGQLAAALGDAGYLLATDAPDAGAADAEDAAEADDAAGVPRLPDSSESDGLKSDAGESDTEQADIAGPSIPTEPPVAVDLRRDAVFLRDNGDLIVASYCPLDRLGQMRRLDYGLATAARMLTALDKPGDYKTETLRWARPDGIYADQAGLYWRQYIDADLTHPLLGTLSLAAKPEALAFGLFGHADVPSQVGDVVRVLTFELGGVKVQGAHTWQITDVAALLWDATVAAQVGEVPFTMDLLVADASVSMHVGAYHAFFEALFPHGTPGLGVSVQGALPGAIRTTRAITELGLPAAATSE